MNVSKPLFHCSFACVFCLHFDLTRKTLFTFFNGKFLNVVIIFFFRENNNFIDLLTAVVAVDHDKCLVFWL